jgi:rhodanese-related sulfurtransferase
MTTQQVFLYAFGTVVIAFYLWKTLRARSIQHYAPAEVAEKLKESRQVVLLDVRTDKEYQQQHIKGSIHIPLQSLLRRTGELEKYKHQEIICCCQTGSRSITAALKLKRLGYTVADMKGGIAEWNFSHIKR